MLSVVSLVVGCAAMVVIGSAALQDVRERLIANRLVVMLLALGVLHHLAAATSLVDWLATTGSALAIAAGIFLVGFVVWRLGGLGGGDVKLLVAATFFVGLDGVLVLLAATALAGGVLALAYVYLPASLRLLALAFAGPTDLATAASQRSLPYGVAIAAGLACAVVPSLPILIG